MVRALPRVDMLCINQGDPAGRGHQVGKMTDIFKSASRVLVWLGPSDPYTGSAIEAMTRLNAEVEVDFVTGEATGVQDVISPIMSLATLTMESLMSIFERPWFGRLWIWQEVCAKPSETTVMIGKYTIDWSAIQKFLLSFHARGPSHGRYHQSVDQARGLCSTLAGDNLIHLLDLTRNSQCSDPRDRIFALLGMLEPGGRLGIEPDYEKEVVDVFMQVVLQSLALQKSLRILSHCKLMSGGVDMPSWVPRWSGGLSIIRPLGHAYLCTNAIAEYAGGNILRVLGVEVGTIASIHAPGYLAGGWHERWSQSEFAARVLSLASFSGGADECDSTAEAVMRTLCWNRSADAYEPPFESFISSSVVKNSLLAWNDYLVCEKSRLKSCEPPMTNSHFERFVAEVQVLAAEYSPFRTEEGRLGLGPKLAAPGEKVRVVLGCNYPLILRPVSENQWVIVGDCYVDDLMSGSALLSSLPDDFRLVTQLNPRTGTWCMAFRNVRTGHVQLEDPRIMDPLPGGWELAEHEDAEFRQAFYNRSEDRCTWEDPRLTPDALRARGVKLKNFDLV
jgi:hypothetical protein